MKKYRRIRDLREDHDMTQMMMAQYLGITQRRYSRYENADSLMPLDVLVEIAECHGVSIDYLLERTDISKGYPKRKK